MFSRACLKGYRACAHKFIQILYYKSVYSDVESLQQSIRLRVFRPVSYKHLLCARETTDSEATLSATISATLRLQRLADIFGIVRRDARGTKTLRGATGSPGLRNRSNTESQPGNTHEHVVDSN